MFSQDEAPLRILNNASLGDPLLVLSAQTEMARRPEGSVQYVQDYRTDVLVQTVESLLLRVTDLERQTPRAYWQRFVAWLRGLWP